MVYSNIGSIVESWCDENIFEVVRVSWAGKEPNASLETLLSRICPRLLHMGLSVGLSQTFCNIVLLIQTKLEQYIYLAWYFTTHATFLCLGKMI